jgi:hypothetical protein
MKESKASNLEGLMLKLIFGILFALVISVPVYAGTNPKCDKCYLYKTAPPSNPWPTKTSRICIYFVQEKEDAVDLFLHRVDGSRIKLPEHDSHKIARAKDSFCIGAHWLDEAVSIELCNGVATSRIHGYLLPQIRKVHSYTACLLGSACH